MVYDFPEPETNIEQTERSSCNKTPFESFSATDGGNKTNKQKPETTIVAQHFKSQSFVFHRSSLILRYQLWQTTLLSSSFVGTAY